MGHTVRRKHTHNAHKRGRQTLPVVSKRPAPMRPTRKTRPGFPPEMVTDHAVLRWLERVVGIDVRDRFIRDMLTPDRADMIAKMQTGKLRVHDTDVVLVVTGGRIITAQIEGAHP